MPATRTISRWATPRLPRSTPTPRNQFAHPELLADALEPWTVREVFVMASPTSDVTVDITDTFDRKVEALLSHASQIKDPGNLREMLHTWGAFQAERGGLPTGRLGESFLWIDTS